MKILNYIFLCGESLFWFPPYISLQPEQQQVLKLNENIPYMCAKLLNKYVIIFVPEVERNEK